MKKFVHLHAHSHYSLLDGLSKIDEMVQEAKKLGMDAIALTDHGNLYGAIEFYKKARKAGIKPILGCEFYVAPNGRENRRAGIDDERNHLILLAKNDDGWKNLLQLVTKANFEGFYYKPRIDHDLVKEYSSGLVCLSGCLGGEVAKALKRGDYAKAKEVALFYRSLFGEDYYLEIQPHAPEIHADLKKLAAEIGTELVATQDVHYVHRDDKAVHEILLAVQTNAKLEDENRFSLKECDLYLRGSEEMYEIFKDSPEAVLNTLKIAERCNVEIELGKIRLPKFDVPHGKTSMDYLRQLTEERILKRYLEITPAVRDRLEMELGVIEKTGYADYFLIVQDFVLWGKERGILSNCRGSAAGSVVSYALGITNLDPLKYELLFERFLNPDRIQMPDIDIDFTDIRRDEVIAYVREKYGHDKVAQIITFGTMMARASIRDTARALGLPYSLGDQIAKLIPFNTSLKDSLELLPEMKELYDSNPDAKKIIDLATRLEGTVRHASVHACGVVISAEPLTDVLPLQFAPQGEKIILTQFEMHSVEDLGLLKMDFLGLKNLTIIEKTLRLIQELRGEKIDIDALPLDDRETFKLFQDGETTGVFQLESSGMRRYLKDLRPTELEDIIVMISLYRPGPMDLIPMYIRRKHRLESVEYLHPKLEPILSSTYGVGVYQEQMMRIAHDLAGFTLAEADTLRKAIGKKIKELLDEQKDKIVGGLIRNGIIEETAEKIWDLFPPFARYGFNRSHAASYAMVSYKTAYLKAHYPVEFTTSLLNISSGDVERINFLVSEAKRLEIQVLPPDINVSFEDFTVDTSQEKNIRFGLMAIKNVGANIVREIIDERRRGGPYENLSDFLTRIKHRDLNKKSLESLIKSGAFDSLDVSRGQALENIEEILKFNQAVKKMNGSNQNDLFAGTQFKMSLRLNPPRESIEKKTLLKWEKELLGLYVSDNPFNSYLAKIKNMARPIRDILELPQGASFNNLRTAGMITAVQKIVTKTGKPMLFVTIEDLTDKIEILVFADTLQKNPAIWEDGKAVFLAGRLSWRDSEPKIICDEAKEL